jgi:hypothetical protein
MESGTGTGESGFHQTGVSQLQMTVAVTISMDVPPFLALTLSRPPPSYPTPSSFCGHPHYAGSVPTSAVVGGWLVGSADSLHRRTYARTHLPPCLDLTA